MFWKNFIDFVENHDKFVVAISTVFIAIFTTFLAIDTRSLWQSSERQLRAYVNIDKSSIYNFSTTEPIQAVFLTKNFGQTPAKKVVIKGTLSIDNNSSLNDPGELSGLLAPTGEMLFVMRSKRPLTQEEFDNISSGRSTVFAKGKITYLDVFGHERYTDFSNYFHGNIAGLGSVLSLFNIKDKNILPLSQSSEGNEAD